MSTTSKCVICGAEVEGAEAIVEGIAICQSHLGEEGKVEWQAIGYFRRDPLAEHRRDILEKHGIHCLLLNSGAPSGIIVMVPRDAAERSQKALKEHQNDFTFCSVCSIEYSAHEVFCPVCGGQ